MDVVWTSFGHGVDIAMNILLWACYGRRCGHANERGVDMLCIYGRGVDMLWACMVLTLLDVVRACCGHSVYFRHAMCMDMLWTGCGVCGHMLWTFCERDVDMDECRQTG